MFLHPLFPLPHHLFNGSTTLKIITASFVTVPQYFAQYHQYTMKELLENAVKPDFEEGYGP